MADFTDHTKLRIFEKLDELQKEIHDTKQTLTKEIHEVSNRLTKVEQNQQAHYKDNDNQHNTMVSNIAEVKTDLESVATRIDEVESVLDKRTGERGVFGNIWHLIIALGSGGLLVTIGGLIAKAIGLFG